MPATRRGAGRPAPSAADVRRAGRRPRLLRGASSRPEPARRSDDRRPAVERGQVGRVARGDEHRPGVPDPDEVRRRGLGRQDRRGRGARGRRPAPGSRSGSETGERSAPRPRLRTTLRPAYDASGLARGVTASTGVPRATAAAARASSAVDRPLRRGPATRNPAPCVAPDSVTAAEPVARRPPAAAPGCGSSARSRDAEGGLPPDDRGSSSSVERRGAGRRRGRARPAGGGAAGRSSTATWHSTPSGARKPRPGGGAAGHRGPAAPRPRRGRPGRWLRSSSVSSSRVHIRPIRRLRSPVITTVIPTPPASWSRCCQALHEPSAVEVVVDLAEALPPVEQDQHPGQPGVRAGRGAGRPRRRSRRRRAAPAARAPGRQPVEQALHPVGLVPGDHDAGVWQRSERRAARPPPQSTACTCTSSGPGRNGPRRPRACSSTWVRPDPGGADHGQVATGAEVEHGRCRPLSLRARRAARRGSGAPLRGRPRRSRGTSRPARSSRSGRPAAAATVTRAVRRPAARGGRRRSPATSASRSVAPVGRRPAPRGPVPPARRERRDHHPRSRPGRRAAVTRAVWNGSAAARPATQQPTPGGRVADPRGVRALDDVGGVRRVRDAQGDPQRGVGPDVGGHDPGRPLRRQHRGAPRASVRAGRCRRDR